VSIASAVSPWIGADIVHETYYQATPDIRSRARRVTTVYDMIHEELGIADQTSAAKRAAIARCDHLICISHSTRDQLIAHFRVPAERTSVVHLACDDFGSLATDSDRVQIGGPYLLHVGRRGGYKNFSVIVKALAGARGSARDARLVSFSKSKFRSQEIEEARNCGLSLERLVCASGPDDRLAQYYRSATALIIPSLHEGFGLPVLEAMSAGCPVICSRRSSLPEIAGDAALYFDPDNVDSVRRAIETVVENDEVRRDLIAKGERRWRQFSWQRCASETAAVYARVLQQT
jgi:glycosyltransferase involved in cell wall biosynthesis